VVSAGTHAMRLVFCGTPQFAVPTLKELLAQKEFDIAAVVTQPDRPRGRGMEVSASPVKEIASAAGVRVLQPEKIRTPEMQEMLRSLQPDAIVIIAYGQIIPARLLTIPKHGWINLHASLLPKYRGAAPIQWAIANGETITGLTSMRIDAGMDTGEMLLQKEFEIGAKETTPELAERLAEAGAPLMLETLRSLAEGKLHGHAQNNDDATYAPLLKKEDGRIDWTRRADEIYNRMRGFTPWPGAFTTFRGQTVHISAEPVSNKIASQQNAGVRSSVPLAPGTLRSDKNALFVACGGATEVRVLSVKREGGKSVDVVQFLHGVRLTDGERFGNSQLR
jgi:methionyl-tRNA formyltransferase